MTAVQESISTDDSSTISDLQTSSRLIGTATVTAVQESISTENSNSCSDLPTPSIAIDTTTVQAIQGPISIENLNSMSDLATSPRSTELPNVQESNDGIDSNYIPKFFESGGMVNSINLLRDFGENGMYEDDIALQISDAITCYGKLYRLSKDRIAIYYHNRKPCEYEYRYYGPIRLSNYDILVRRR